jgi:hypothetical protein
VRRVRREEVERRTHLRVDPLEAPEEVKLCELLAEESRLELLQQEGLSLVEELMAPPELAPNESRLRLELSGGHCGLRRRRKGRAG